MITAPPISTAEVRTGRRGPSPAPARLCDVSDPPLRALTRIDGESLARASALRLGVVRNGRIAVRRDGFVRDEGRGAVFLLPAELDGVTTDPGFAADVLLAPPRLAELCGEVGSAPSVLPAVRATAALYGRIRRLIVGRAPRAEEFRELVACVASAAPKSLQTLTPALRERIRVACEHLSDNLAAPYVLQPLAARAGLSPWHFIRTFHRELGEPPRQYLMGLRLRHAADLLLETSVRITDVALAAGFPDISHFNATFREAFGVSPGQWRASAI